jgi:hypothetical protein
VEKKMHPIGPYAGNLAAVHASTISDHRPASQLDKQLAIRLIMASMPLIGIVLGIVGVAAWTAI